MEETSATHLSPDSHIVSFIRKHHVMTIATSSGNIPYCANLFYAYLPDENCFVVTSEEKTRHAKEAMDNSSVAGSIVLETRIVGKVQGLQFQGRMERPATDLLPKLKSSYLKRFPYAVLMDLDLWVITMDFAKLTDNRLGFGKKLIWPEAPKK